MFFCFILNKKNKKKEKNSHKDTNYSRRSKRQRNQNSINNNKASTSTNLHFSNNSFEELNTEFITSYRNKFIQLSSIYNTYEGTSNPFLKDCNSLSIQKSNFFILNYLFIFHIIINLNKIFY